MRHVFAAIAALSFAIPVVALAADDNRWDRSGRFGNGDSAQVAPVQSGGENSGRGLGGGGNFSGRGGNANLNPSTDRGGRGIIGQGTIAQRNDGGRGGDPNDRGLAPNNYRSGNLSGQGAAQNSGRDVPNQGTPQNFSRRGSFGNQVAPQNLGRNGNFDGQRAPQSRDENLGNRDAPQNFSRGGNFGNAPQSLGRNGNYENQRAPQNLSRGFDVGRPGVGQSYFSYRGNNLAQVRVRPFYYPPGYGYRQWRPGQILPYDFLSGQFYIDDFYDVGLEPPPPGYRWVQYGTDAVLVDVYSGRIVDVVYDVFYW